MAESQMRDIQETIWQFLRGDLPTGEFEQWVYDTSELETLCDPDLYFEIISADYRNRFAVWDIREPLETWVDYRFPRSCDCITWANNETFCVDSETANLLRHFEILRKRTPWLELIQCVHCNTHWYVGTDTGDDYYYLYRLKKEEIEKILIADDWPNCFDGHEHLWPSEGWLRIYGYESLEDWRCKNQGVT